MRPDVFAGHYRQVRMLWKKMDEEGVISESAAISREDLDTMGRKLGLT